jgi:hypothetical protein
MWNKLPIDKKKIYISLGKHESIRYNNQNKQIKELGYFIREDGTKSNDPSL